MSESLFTSQTPSVDGTDGAPGITTATTLKFATAGTIDAVRFYATASPGGTYTVAVWQVTNSDAGFGGTGTLLASKVVGGTPTGSAWNTITLDTPVSVDTTHLYRVGVHNGSRYVATNSFFTSALTNGNITAPANNSDPLSNGWTLWQGTFIVNASLTYPTSVGTSASYFVDAVFTATGSGSTVNGDAAQTVTLAGTADAAGVRSTTAAQTVTLAGTAVAAGVRSSDAAQTASFAGTAVASGVRPTDAAQTVTLAGAADAAGVRPTDAAQTVTLAGAAVANVVTPGISADASQEVTLAGAAAGAVVHNAQALQIIGLVGVAVQPDSTSTAVQTGSWETLRSIVHEARVDAARNAERAANPLDCPEHGWPLQRTSRGWHCAFGGHVVR